MVAIMAGSSGSDGGRMGLARRPAIFAKGVATTMGRTNIRFAREVGPQYCAITRCSRLTVTSNRHAMPALWPDRLSLRD
jgi:hypothetical protein